MKRYERQIYVTCRYCHTEFNEKDVEITDIESNELGQDVVKFKCPECGKDTSALRRG